MAEDKFINRCQKICFDARDLSKLCYVRNSHSGSLQGVLQIHIHVQCLHKHPFSLMENGHASKKNQVFN